MVALIPARAGSKRVPGKNTRLLAGRPLICHTIAAAQQSGVFNAIYVCTDDEQVAAAVHDYRNSDECYQCHLLTYRREPVADLQADIEWVREVLSQAIIDGRPDNFAILRPTSPFRTAETIRRAYREFQAMAECGDSIRAVRPVKDHPYKCWTWDGAGMPIIPLFYGKHADGTPWHSSPTQSLTAIYVQSSMLDMGWTSNVEVYGTIHGRKIGPFFGSDVENLSIDTEADWREAVRLVETGEARLPPLTVGAEAATAPAQ